jgi:hypothetical protein
MSVDGYWQFQTPDLGWMATEAGMSVVLNTGSIVNGAATGCAPSRPVSASSALAR